MKKLILYIIPLFLFFFVAVMAQEDPCPDCDQDFDSDLDDYYDDDDHHDDCDDHHDDYDDGPDGWIDSDGIWHDYGYDDYDDDDHHDDCENDNGIDNVNNFNNISYTNEDSSGENSGGGSITGNVVEKENLTIENTSLIIVGKVSADIDTQSATSLLGSVSSNSNESLSIEIDEEVDVENKDYIVIGGPCANQLASELLGKPENCAEGFEEGKAILQLFEIGSNNALLIAGYSGEDTKKAVEYYMSRTTKITGKIIIDTSSLQVIE
tara:strand:+ start:87 stop:884 length:798 start_codon:yes stop_codon:yes gene_type:complete